MNAKVANRYVDLLTDIIDTKVRTEGKDVLFNKNYIMEVIGRYDDEVTKTTDKIYKDTVKWFKERYIFGTDGETFGLKYKLHSKFQYKVSKNRRTVEKQCQFIIGQLFIFSKQIWEDTTNLYADVINIDGLFEFLPTITNRKVADTVSILLIHKYNTDFEGVYTYEVLQTLSQLKTPFEIKIKNKTINSTLKEVILKKVVFNIDTVTITFNNSQFELESLGDIKGIYISIPKDIYNNIDESLEYLEKTDTESSKKIVELLREYKVANENFFQNILEEKK